jgi:hypothetical protein
VSRAEAVAAWTLHYEADPARARDRLVHLRTYGVPVGHTAELIGATLALTPQDQRCTHWGDKRTCPQCLLEDTA